jgi:hypothetical protein
VVAQKRFPVAIGQAGRSNKRPAFPTRLAFLDYDPPAGDVGRTACEPVRRDRLVLVGLPESAAGSIASARFVAPRALRMGFDVVAAFSSASTGAGAASDCAAVSRFAGLRPNPSSLATADRRSEYAGAVRG